jgi:HEPN domain-containing protein
MGKGLCISESGEGTISSQAVIRGESFVRPNMIRISLFYFFDFAIKVDPLKDLPDYDAQFNAVFAKMYPAQMAIESLYNNNSLYASYLRSSSYDASNLLSKLNAIVLVREYNSIVTRLEFYEIKRLYDIFKIALITELSALHYYFVDQKGPFDTNCLLMFGEKLFPDELKDKVPSAVIDAQEGAKCIAYNVPTAAAYHCFRAVESVLRAYYAHVTHNAPPPKFRSIGVYVRALSKYPEADVKILEFLKQLSTLYRNPIIHPEIFLTMEDAISIYGLSRSIINEMLKRLP